MQNASLFNGILQVVCALFLCWIARGENTHTITHKLCLVCCSRPRHFTGCRGAVPTCSHNSECDRGKKHKSDQTKYRTELSEGIKGDTHSSWLRIITGPERNTSSTALKIKNGMDSFCELWGAFGIPCFMVGTYKIYNTWHSGIGGTADGFRSSLPPGFEKKKTWRCPPWKKTKETCNYTDRKSTAHWDTDF